MNRSKAESLVLDKHSHLLTNELSQTGSSTYPKDEIMGAAEDVLEDDLIGGGSSESTDTSDDSAGQSYKIPENLMSKVYVQRTIESTLAENGLPAHVIKDISDEVSRSVADVMQEQLKEIEEAIKSQDESRLKKVSKMILTAIIGKLADQVFDIVAQYSDQVIQAIIEAISSMS